MATPTKATEKHIPPDRQAAAQRPATQTKHNSENPDGMHTDKNGGNGQQQMGQTGTMEKTGTDDHQDFPTHWATMKQQARTRWSQLSDEDVTQVSGRYELLVEALQRRYGYDYKRAEQEIDKVMKEKHP